MNELMQVKNLKMHFPFSKSKGIFKKATGVLKAVDDVSFDLYSGETFGIVGESGCGKTTLGRSLIRIYKPTSGEVLWRDRDDKIVDLAKLPEKQMRKYWQDIRMVFQDPKGSLNPRLTVKDIISEAMKENKMGTDAEITERVKYLMSRVGLRPEYLYRYPHAFSGGERQRIGIAAALSVNPRLVIADEPVSALDVSVQAQTINLMEDLQQDFKLTYIFIAHNLSVVQHISDRVMVMYVGKMVELADTNTLYRRPMHPYTNALLSAVPYPDPAKRGTDHIELQGNVADPANPPSGCYFHPRCPYATEQCRTQVPTPFEIESGHFVSCHRAAELDLPSKATFKWT